MSAAAGCLNSSLQEYIESGKFLVSLPYHWPMNDESVDDRWRQTHLGRLLGHAMRRFDARVLR
jgi:hypothetical protein